MDTISAPRATPASASREQLVLAEQIRYVDRAMQVSPFALVLVAGVLVYALRNEIDRTLLWVWFALVVGVQATRLAESMRFRRSNAPPARAQHWARRYTLATLASGCVWGAGAVLLFPTQSLPLQALLTMVLVGLASASIVVHTAYHPIHYMFCVPTLGALALRTGWQGDFLGLTTAFLILVFLGFLLVTGIRISARLREAIAMRFENLDLIEELKRQKLAAEDAQRQAEEANQAKSRFLAAASHDLRQPLHALALFTGVLEQQVQQSNSRPVIQSMRASVDALESLFNELLDISKLDAGVITPSIDTFALAPVFERVRNDFEPQAVAQGLRLRVMPTKLATSGDPLLLERILRNLVSNAIRYTPARRGDAPDARAGRVILGCRRHGEHIAVQVIDSGIGIPDAERERIFEEFYQIGNPERDRGKGLGLGLAIVKRLSELLGYDVRIDSQMGAGSRFSISVPNARNTQAWRQTQPPAPALEAGVLADQFVIVIEDDEAAREGLRALLRSWQCNVLAAASLGELQTGLEARGERPDVLISDYRLRDGQDGIGVIRALRARYGADLPAIIITGDMRQAPLHAANESEPVLWLQKPVAPERLQAALARALSMAEKPAH